MNVLVVRLTEVCGVLDGAGTAVGSHQPMVEVDGRGGAARKLAEPAGPRPHRPLHSLREVAALPSLPRLNLASTQTVPGRRRLLGSQWRLRLQWRATLERTSALHDPDGPSTSTSCHPCVSSGVHTPERSWPPLQWMA